MVILWPTDIIKNEKAIENNTIYCKICFDKQLDEHPDDPLSSLAIRKQLTHYAENVSTGNMLLHLSMKHRIVSKEQVKITADHVSNFYKPSTYATTKSNKIFDCWLNIILILKKYFRLLA
jgi:hypothetical protein